MKNYFDKYIKYKSKYIKIKNYQFGGETYDCSDKKITEIICEQNPNGQWDNKEECEKSKICIENNRLINNHEVIMLIRKNKKLLEKYNIYKEGSKIPLLSNLKDSLNKIKFVEENKDLLEKYKKSKIFLEKKTLDEMYQFINIFKKMELYKNLFLKYNIYKEGSTIPLLSKLLYSLDKIELIEANKEILKKYNVYNENNEDNLVLKDLLKKNHEYNEDNLVLKYFLEKLEVIKSIEANKELLQKYNAYNENNLDLNNLKDDLDKIKFIEENKELLEKYKEGSEIFLEKRTLDNLHHYINICKKFDDARNLFIKYNIYKEDSKIPDSLKLFYSLDKIILIEANKELLKKYNVYNKDNLDVNYLINKLEVIKLIEANKDLLQKYNAYNVDNLNINYLKTTIKIIKIIEENKDLLKKYNVYNEDNLDINYLTNKLQVIKLIEANRHLLKKYNAYNEDNLDINYLIDKLKVIKLIESKEANPKSIELIQQNPNLKQYVGYRENDIVKSVEKVQQDIDNIKKFHEECKSFEIPKTFYISGLLTFAVYKNVELNKIIYLLGEKHNFSNLCDIKETDGIKHYSATEFFFSLLQESSCGKNNGKYNNKLDVFLEMYYNPLNDFFSKKFNSDHDFKNYSDSYMTRTNKLIYNKHCYPEYLKNNNKESELCIYDPYVRFHHGDLRHINDKFIQYIRSIYLLYGRTSKDKLNDSAFVKNNTQFSNDTNYVSNIYSSSQFMNKIIKQIDNIDNKNIKKVFEDLVKRLIDRCTQIITSGDINYKSVLQIFNDDIKIKKNVVSDIYLDIMDIYLLSRVFRSFDKDSHKYNASNIIIYTGNAHIRNYIKLMPDLKFEKIYDFNSTISGKNACIKVDNFNMEYY